VGADVRVRVGVARFDDGWNVIVSCDGVITVYDPTFPTEAEAQAMAAKAGEAIGRIPGSVEVSSPPQPPQI
jgi:hypothetical protein